MTYEIPRATIDWNSKEDNLAHLALPASRGAVGFLLSWFIVASLVYLATQNLIHSYEIPVISSVASAAWLVIVFFVIQGLLKGERGVRQFLIDRLGKFSSKQSIDAKQLNSDLFVISFGYKLFGRRLHYLRIDSSSIESVSWGSGQGRKCVARHERLVRGSKIQSRRTNEQTRAVGCPQAGHIRSGAIRPKRETEALP